MNVASKPQIETLRDLVASSVLVVMGLTLTRYAVDPAPWIRLQSAGILREAAGHVIRERGTVRIKREGASVWEDLLQENRQIFAGDMVFTYDDGAARIALDDGKDEAEILPNSLVVIQGRESSTERGSWLDALRLSILGAPRAERELDLRKGKIRVRPSTVDTPMRVKAFRNTVDIRAKYPGERFELNVDDDHPEQPYRISEVLPNEAASPPPHVLSATPAASWPNPEALRPAAAIPVPRAMPMPRAPDRHPISILPSLALTGQSVDTRLGARDDASSIAFLLRWKAIKGAREYTVTLSEGSRQFLKKKTAVPRLPVTLYKVVPEGLTFQVAALLLSGETVESKPAPIRIRLAPPIPREPERLKHFAAGSQVLLIWEKTSLTLSYEVEIALEPSFRDPLARETTSRNHLELQPKDSAVYFWRVRSRVGSSWSDWSGANSFVIEKPGNRSGAK